MSYAKKNIGLMSAGKPTPVRADAKVQIPSVFIAVMK